MIVTSVKYNTDSKIYRLQNKRKIKMHRFCCLGERDKVVINNLNQIYVRCKNGKAQIPSR